MRIGILTLPLHSNYGGILQAFALQTVIKRLGHEVWLINRRSKPFTKWKTVKSITKRIIYRALGRPVIIFLERDREAAFKYTFPFISNYIGPITDPFFTEDELKKGIEKYKFDALIVGSDQIWRPKFFPNIQEAYFSFINGKEIKRISYATSFGTDDWEYTDLQSSLCGELLRKFNAVSVREESALVQCKYYFQVDATHVLDPTMLLESFEYIRLFKQCAPRHGVGSMFEYILDDSEEKCNIINWMVKESGYIPFGIKTRSQKNRYPLDLKLCSPVEDWLQSFNDAEFIVTDSFHGCVFSILFNKPFMIIGNKQRGMTRFQSLLKIFDLEDRLISSASELNSEKFNKKINWNLVNQKLAKHREYSLKFLTDNLR